MDQEVAERLATIESKVAALEAQSHPPVEGLCLAEDVERELRRLDRRIREIERT